MFYRSFATLCLLTGVCGAKGELVPVADDPVLNVPEGVIYRTVADKERGNVTSPTAITFDDKGALYVAETHRFRFGIEDDRDHLYWYLDDIAAQTVADRLALHEKWKDKLPLEKLTEKSELVRKLEDEDEDGFFEKSTVFADGFNDPLDGTAAGVFAYGGTVYFACIPRIWTLRDTKGTGVADERKVLQDGFGVRISFSGHDLNGFALGPDGRLYATIGDRGYNIVTKEGQRHVHPDQGSVFRFEPDGSGFEVYHTGLRNPKEIAFDDFGNAITVDNNSDQGDKARVVYVVEGADSGWTMEHQTMHSFHRQIGLEKYPVNRWMEEQMWQPQNDFQPAYIVPPVANLTNGPSGLTYHPGAGYLEEEAGRFLICDYRGSIANSGVWSFKVESAGAGMKLVDARQALWGVAATDVEYAWDGKLFVSDFKGGWSSHQEGRVLSLDAAEKTWRSDEAREAAGLMREGFEQRSSQELAALLRHADQRIRIRAELALSRKRDALDRFRKATMSNQELERFHGIWGLGILARRGSGAALPESGGTEADEGLREKAVEALQVLLKHADAEARAQAVKALGDVPGRSGSNGSVLAPLLADDSPRVRMFAAITAGKTGDESLIPAILSLLVANGDADPYLRHAGVSALQALASPELLGSLRDHESPSVRLAAVVALRRLKDAGVSRYLDDAEKKVSDEAIRAIHDVPIEEARGAVAALLDGSLEVKRSPMMWRRLLNSAFRLGGEENAKRLIRLASTATVPVDARREALRLLTVWAAPPVVDQTLGRYAPLSPRGEDEIVPLLTEALPALLKVEGTLADALDLMIRYELKTGNLEDSFLLTIVKNTTLSAQARVNALRLYAARNPAELDRSLLALVDETEVGVSIEALWLLVGKFPDAALDALTRAVVSERPALAQMAWGELAKRKEPVVVELMAKQLVQLKDDEGVAPAALELLAATEQRKESAIVEALAAYEGATAMREKTDPLTPWLGLLEGGDAERGAQIFQSHPASECRRCHRAEGSGQGEEAGPNLAGVARRGDRRYLLESLTHPSAKVAPGYGVVSVTLKNGAVTGGYLLEESADFIDLNTGSESWRIKRADIAEMAPAVSAMPPMGVLLKPAELRDLVAWLSTLTQQDHGEKKRERPPLLDPEILKK